MSSSDAALFVENVSKSFGRIQAVDRLSLEVYPGQMTGFLGPNGAGKSTTLYMIPQLVHPSAGRIEIFDLDVRENFKQAMRYVGAMVESPAFYEYLSGRKNLELTGRLRGNVKNAQIDEILERVGLYERRNDKVKTYSHGMKQRLGLGMALLGSPRLLILDEPTSGMDPEGTREILGFLQQKVKEEKLAVFISSHLLYEVETYCDKVFVINQGRLIASGKVKEILAAYENVVRVGFRGKAPEPESLLKEDGIEKVVSLSSSSLEVTLSNQETSRLNGFLLQKGYRISSLVPKHKTLKEFFLQITGKQEKG